MTVYFSQLQCMHHLLEVKLTSSIYLPSSRHDTRYIRTKEYMVKFKALDYWTTYIVEMTTRCDGQVVERAVDRQNMGPGSKYGE